MFRAEHPPSHSDRTYSGKALPNTQIPQCTHAPLLRLGHPLNGLPSLLFNHLAKCPLSNIRPVVHPLVWALLTREQPTNAAFRWAQIHLHNKISPIKRLVPLLDQTFQLAVHRSTFVHLQGCIVLSDEILEVAARFLSLFGLVLVIAVNVRIEDITCQYFLKAVLYRNAADEAIFAQADSSIINLIQDYAGLPPTDHTSENLPSGCIFDRSCPRARRCN